MAQSLFSKYLGKLEVDVDGEILELDARLKDKQRIMSLMSKFGEEITEDSLEKLTQVYMEILKRSYPDVPEEQFEAFLLHKLESFMTGLAVAFEWTTKDELEKKMKERVKKGIERAGVGG